MNLQNQRFKKICGCYASNSHLAAMILPYVDNKVQRGEKVATILEEGIEEEMEELINKVNITTETKEKILNIGWTSKKEIKLEDMNINNEEINIIITGNEKEIERKNQTIKGKLNKKTKINLINLYKIEEIKSINEILEKHDLIINTSGIHEIQDIYPNYLKENIKNVVNK